MLGIVGINPQVVMVAVGAAAERSQGLAAIDGAERADVQQIDSVPGVGIGLDVRVVERALPHSAVCR